MLKKKFGLWEKEEKSDKDVSQILLLTNENITIKCG